MKPKKREKFPQEDLFRSRLDNIIKANVVDWDFLETKVVQFYKSEGRPGVPVRLMVGLHLLKQM